MAVAAWRVGREVRRAMTGTGSDGRLGEDYGRQRRGRHRPPVGRCGYWTVPPTVSCTALSSGVVTIGAAGLDVADATGRLLRHRNTETRSE